jgi:hypothetical protein
MATENPCDILNIVIAETHFTVRVERCPHCKEIHEHVLSIELLSHEKNTINLPCPNVKRLPRFTRFYFDFTPNMINRDEVDASVHERMKGLLIEKYGEDSIDDKYLRWSEVSRANMWVLEEFNGFLDEIAKAYIQGYYYLSITGACCLTERVLNRLVVKIKAHHKASPRYKLFYDREQQIQNWSLLIDTLEEWDVLNDEQVKVCKRLYKYRNETVHYIPDYDFKSAAPEVIKLTTRLIDSLFSVFERRDVYNIFTIPGEIWVKEEKLNDPFVKEFVLPCCSMGGAVSQFDYENNEYLEDGAVVGDLSEGEFISIRTDYRNNPDKYLRKVTPILCRYIYNEREGFIRLI